MGSENADRCARNAENGFAFIFFVRYNKDSDEFLNNIVRVTGIEIRVSFCMLKPKNSQNSGCIHIHQTRRKSLSKHLSARKLMASVFWDMKGVLMMKFMQQGTTITSEVYFETLKIA
jgi:hypothetical protein